MGTIVVNVPDEDFVAHPTLKRRANNYFKRAYYPGAYLARPTNNLEVQEFAILLLHCFSMQ